MTQKPKQIIIDDAVPFAEAFFSHLGQVTTLPGKSITADTVKHADALIIRSRTQINANLLANSAVKFVGSTVVGLDHVDQAYLANKNIHFYSAQGCNANSVAEYIITVLLELAEHFDYSIKDKTLGIIGVGHVGQRLYNKARALGMTCLLNDPPRVEQQPGLVESDNFVDLDTCLKADIITVHTPLVKNGKYPSYDLISAEKLTKIKPNQILINAARGGIINEQAWINTPTKANIIDCWENEPHINKELYNTAFLATPHTAGHSLDAKVAGSKMVYDELCKFWNIPPQTAWQQHLPDSPSLLHLTNSKTEQTTLQALLRATHNIFDDDRAIRSPNITEVHKKYENYRRNFPVYREWNQHIVAKSSQSSLNQQLISLNFKLL